MLARIVKVLQQTFLIETWYQQKLHQFTVKSNRKFKHLVAGDLVFIANIPNSKELQINNYYQAKKKFTRIITPILNVQSKLSTANKQQSIVNNINYLAVITAIKPGIHYDLIDRYLVGAKIHNLKMILVVNKIDLLNQQELTELKQKLFFYRDILEEIFFTVGFNNYQHHLPENNYLFFQFIKDKNILLTGESGVGKSTLINNYFSKKIAKTNPLTSSNLGRHTTSNTQGYSHPILKDESKIKDINSLKYLYDSPGIRQYTPPNLNLSNLLNAYSELKNLECRFKNCTHRNELGCGLQNAIEQDQIKYSRYKSYIRLLKTIKVT